MVRVVFHLADGSRRVLDAAPGSTVMDCALDNDVPGIRAQCGGGCTCATCHCYVLGAWAERLPAPHPDEAEMLEYVWRPGPGSRLSCQIVLDASLDGIEVRVPARQS